jgi:ammonia channel protein AmtB
MKKSVMLIAMALASMSAYAGTAYLKYERNTGMTKQCYYDYLGSEYVRTVSVTALCPLTIQVNR